MNINLVPAQELVGLYDKRLMIKKIIIAASVVLGIVILAVIVQAFKTGQKARLVRSLEEQYGKYTSLESSIKSLRKEVTDNKDKQRKLASILPEQFFWSEKLLIISRLKAEGIWFGNLSVNLKHGYVCTLKGYLFNLDDRKRPIAQLNDYIKKLKNDPDMNKSFSRIKVTDIKNETVHNKKVLGFTLTLEHQPLESDK